MEEQPTMKEILSLKEKRVEFLMEEKVRLQEELKAIDDELTEAGVLFEPPKEKPERRQYRAVLRKILAEADGMLVDELISLAASHDHLGCDQKYVREAFNRWAAMDKSVIVSEDEEHRDFVHIKKEE